MPVNITDVSTFTAPIVIPADSDPADRTYIETLAQGLANRTRFLHDRAGAGDATRIVRVGATRAALEGNWTLSNQSIVALSTTRSRATYDVTAGVELPWKGSVTQVQVQVQPGTTRSDPADQMQVTLYRVEINPTIAVQVGSTVKAANTTNLQLITITETITINGEALSGNNYRLVVLVDSGDTEATPNDSVYDVRFTTTTTVQ